MNIEPNLFFGRFGQDSGSADKTMKTDTQGSPSPLQQKDIIDKD